MRKDSLFYEKKPFFLLQEHPVLEHLLPFGGENALGVELYPSDVELAMAQGHDLSFVRNGGDFEAVGETITRDHPRVVAPYGDVGRQACEERVAAHYMTRRCDTVEHVAEVFQLPAKDLADGLMTEADTQDGLVVGIGADDIEQKARLRRDARSWTQDNLTVGFEVGKLELVVAQHGDFGAQLFY